MEQRERIDEEGDKTKEMEGELDELNCEVQNGL